MSGRLLWRLVGVELGIWLNVGIFLAGVWSIVVIVNTELVDTAVVDDDDETNAVSAPVFAVGTVSDLLGGSTATAFSARAGADGARTRPASPERQGEDFQPQYAG